eukprot:4464934-Pyramimonas_sp.AAC.1
MGNSPTSCTSENHGTVLRKPMVANIGFDCGTNDQAAWAWTFPTRCGYAWAFATTFGDNPAQY